MAFFDRDVQYHSGGYDTGPGRQRARRPVTDYGSTMVQWMHHRKPKYRKQRMMEAERPSPSYIVDMLPPVAHITNPADTIPAKQLHSSLNKIKHPINLVKWTPEGRRLLTGSSSGEFTLWNGMGFNFETIMQAHDSAIRTAVWSHSNDWLISADHDGYVKYWQPNFNNVQAFRGHEAPIRDMAFSPTDVKFLTASDDSTLKIWDFSTGREDSTLSGHNWDVKCADWHPTKGLIVSGSKDHQVKLWDPRTSRCLTTLYGHKNLVLQTVFEPVRGQLLATSARDQTARVFDLRMMRDVCLLRGHEKDIVSVAWHPIHVSMLSTGGWDGVLNHYLLDEPNTPPGSVTSISPYDSPDPSNTPAQTIYPAHRIQYAHDSAIWSLDWHPLGHILASGSNDRVTRFWARARPGDIDCFNDKYHLGEAAAEAHGTWTRQKGRQQARHDEEQEVEDEAEGLVDQTMPARQSFVPGLPGISAGLNGSGPPAIPGMSAAPPPIPQPNGGQIPSINPNNMPDFSELAKIFGGQLPQPGQLPPIPPPNFAAFQSVIPPPHGLPPGFPLPPNFPPPGFAQDSALSGTPIANNEIISAAVSSVRKRGPLPSQQDSMREEMRRGNYKNSR